MTFRLTPFPCRAGLVAAASLGLMSLAGCAGGPSTSRLAREPDPILPTEQYPLRADTHADAINLRVNANGLSENQRRALEQLAGRANWMDGNPVTLEIVTSDNPQSIAAGRAMRTYLIDRHVSEDAVSSSSHRDQPDDVVTITVVSYDAHVYSCNRNWENVAATGSNAPYHNYGCALTANLAAQIADPRDLDSPTPATPADAARRSAVLEHYRRGEKTGAETDDNAKGTISQAIK